MAKTQYYFLDEESNRGMKVFDTKKELQEHILGEIDNENLDEDDTSNMLDDVWIIQGVELSVTAKFKPNITIKEE